MHGLIAATDCLAKVSQANPSVALSSAAALRALGQLRARLEYCDIDWLLSELDQEMSGVQDVSSEVTRAVSASFFAAADPTAWITEGTR
jgi:hypothetical protein